MIHMPKAVHGEIYSIVTGQEGVGEMETEEEEEEEEEEE